MTATITPIRGASVSKVHPKLHELADEDVDDLLDTAKHEAGHAVIAKLCGGVVTDATIHSSDDEDSIAINPPAGSVSHRYIYDTYKKVMVSTAGLAGSLIDEDSPRPFYRSDPSGRSGDYDLEPGTNGDDKLIYHDVFKDFIGPGSVQVHPDFDPVKWVNEAYYQAHTLLRQYRPVFDELVALLLEKKNLTTTELTPILNKLPRKSPRSKLFTWSITHKAVQALLAANPNDPRLEVYKAAKRAMENNTPAWEAKQALEAAKKAYDAISEVQRRAQVEIKVMLHDRLSLIEAKEHFLKLANSRLETAQASLKAQRQLPWQERSWQYMRNLRDNIKTYKAEVVARKADLKALVKARKTME